MREKEKRRRGGGEKEEVQGYSLAICSLSQSLDKVPILHEGHCHAFDVNKYKHWVFGSKENTDQYRL